MVIVGVDGSEHGRHALHWAAGEAARRDQPLQALHAVAFPDQPVDASPGTDTMVGLDEARRIVDDAVADVGRIWPQIAFSASWIVGTPWAVLTRAATESDLIVVGSYGRRHPWSGPMGSVAADVAQRATCPVVVVRTPRDRYGPDRHGVVVGIDGSRASLVAAGFAFAAASARRLPLTVVHAVWNPMESPTVVLLPYPANQPATNGYKTLDVVDEINAWRERYPEVGVVARYENGQPAQVLTDPSTDADLLVVGARGRTAARTVPLGSVSRDALQQAPCPVAVVRGFAHEDLPAATPAVQPVGG